MNTAKLILKCAVIASSVLLVVVLIGCRTGVIQPFSSPTPEHTAPAIVPPQTTTPEPAPTDKFMIMGGSKSSFMISPTNGLTPAGQTNTVTEQPKPPQPDK